MKKPKKLKYPKKPKASASLTVLENYVKRRKDVDKANADREREYKKALTLRDKIKKM
jgi:hypothetical protein